MHIENISRWRPPPEWPRITVIDAHTAGEPLRVIIDGYPPLEGDSILARRRHAQQRLDHLRRALMWEPRGHADMYGCLLTEPVTEEADLGVLFLHNEGYSTMCGHGIIAVTRVALETGLLPRTDPVTCVRIDTPAGLITAFGHWENGQVRRVSFENVPSYVDSLDQVVEVPGLGSVRYDLAFGGAYYAFVQAEEVGLTCEGRHAPELIAKGMAIKRAIMDSRAIRHPFEEDMGFLYGTIFIGPPEHDGSHSRNVCIFAEGEVDRSPTGTGVSARAAIHHARGEIATDEPLVIESIIGSTFTVRVKAATTFGPHEAIIPEVSGEAYITGRSTFCLDPDDPLRHGFLLRML